MSGFRDFVTGSDGCTPSDGAGPSNAVGNLVNTLLGSASKTQEQLRELPVVQPHPHGAGPSMFHADVAGKAMDGISIPGLGPPSLANADVDAFLHGAGAVPSVDEFEQIFNEQARHAHHGPFPPGLSGPVPAGRPAVLQQQFRAFFDSGRMKAPFQAPPAAGVSLPVAEQCRIRDRSTILSRHLFADMGEGFADQQVGHLLASLNIDPSQLPSHLSHVHDPQWHQVWQSAAAHPQEPPAAAEMAAAAREWDTIWGHPEQQQRRHPLSTGWAEEFHEQHPLQQGVAADTEAVAKEFEQWNEQQVGVDTAQQVGVDLAHQQQGMREHSTKLADVLSRDPDPKMRSSKFLQFVSKMSRGELLVDDNNKLVERSAGDAMADEFHREQQQAGPPGAWATEFEQSSLNRQQQEAGPSGWLQEFTQEQQQGQNGQAVGPPQDWADEFAKRVGDLNLDEAGGMEAAWKEVMEGEAWAEEYKDTIAEGSEAEWERIFSQHANTSTTADGEYVFAKNNPFLGDPDALQKGKQLFKEGLLTEAAMALEAEVQARPDSVEAWRLLGTVQCENDDDRQAIAALGQALKADPTNLGVLLALGVSHTNEFDQGKAVGYLMGWLQQHPQYGNNAHPPPDTSQAVSHSTRLFEEAARTNPQDPELFKALGVLYHLGRQYDKAIEAFDSALQFSAHDYSLWNKLGATLANHNHSQAAISAYQKALELKPNYMRAWTNMGISFANLGDYEQSARYYVRALEMNPKADHVWGYLRTSLSCAGKHSLLQAVEEENLDLLREQLPLQ